MRQRVLNNKKGGKRMVRFYKQIFSLMLVIAITFSFVNFNVHAAAGDIRFDFEKDTEDAIAGSQTTESAIAENGECILTTKNTDLSGKNIRLTLPEIDLGNGGYYMYARVRYELPGGLELASTFCMDVATKAEYGKTSGSWKDYDVKKIDITKLKGKQTLSLSFLTKKETVTGVGKVYIDWVVLSKSSVAPSAEGGVESERVEMFTNSDSKAVRLLVSLGIMNYDENVNYFWDDAPVRRGQMAEILCNLYGLDAKKSETPIFTDVDEDERAVVETVVQNGYMSGYGNGIFAPDEHITGEQLMTVFVTMLGGKSAAEAAGGYPDGYYKIGNKLGLRTSRLGAIKGPATRLDVANIIYDAMHADYLQIEGFQGNVAIYDTRKGETFLTEVMGIYCTEGIMTADDATSLTSSGGRRDGHIVVNDILMNDPKKLSSGYLGYDVIVYEKRTDDGIPGDIIFIEETSNNDVVYMDGTENVFANVNGKEVTYYKNNKRKTLKLSNAIDMIYNGVATDYSSALVNADTNDEITFIDNDNDGKYNLVVVYDYQDYLTNIVRSESKEISLQYSEKTLRLEDNIVRVYNKGIPSTLSSIESNAIISVAVSTNMGRNKLYTIKTGFETVTGAVDSMSIAEEQRNLEIGGKEYRLSDYAENLISKNKISDISSGDEGTFYLNVNGEIATYTFTESKEKIGCLVTYGFGRTGFEPEFQVLIYTEDEKLVELSCADKIRINGNRMRIEDLMNNEDLIEKLSSKQLVKYNANSEILKSLDFAETEYNLTKFSKDLPYTTLKCNRTSILSEMVDGEYIAEKYRITADTKTFKIPIYRSLADGEAYWDTSLYDVVKGQFMSVNATAKLELYDVHEDGTVDYVLWGYNPYANRITSGHSLAVIIGMGKAINQYDEVVDVIYAYNEAGNEIRLLMREDGVFVQNLDPATLEIGDIINYFTDNAGDVFQVRLRRNGDTPNGVTTISSETKATTDLMLNGKVAFKSNEQFSVYTTNVRPETPLDVEGIVSNTGAAIYLCEDNEIYAIGFDEIEPDDQITAIVDGSNKTRVLVVYR